jgi:DNA polymerase elongation subunit (family B)
LEFYTQVSRIANTICYRGYKDGRRVSFREPFSPTIYLAVNEETEWQTLQGQYVYPIQKETMKEATAALSNHDEIANSKVYGNSNFAAQWIQERYPNDIKYDPKQVLVANIDIEVESDDGFPDPEKAEKMVQSICLKYFGRDQIYVWALGDYDPYKTQLDVDFDNIYFIKCDDEIDLLLKFIGFWHSKDTCPDVVTGWNVRQFDIPYLVNRVERLLGHTTIKKFSPWGQVRAKEIGMMNKKTQVYELVGIEQLDYWDLFQKFGNLTYGVQESYRLDHIAFVVLGEKKLSYEEHGNLFTLYKEDYQKFIDYNIKDVLLVEKIDEVVGLINLAMTIAYKGGCNYQEAFGTTQLWDTYIYRELCKQKKVVPPKVDRPSKDIAGGYVKTPMVGRHSWIVSFDLNSLYPHLMMQYNMSPETVIDRATPGVTVDNCLERMRPPSSLPDHCIAANGVHFRKDQKGVIPEIIEGLYAERKEIKKEMLSNQSLAEKGDKLAGATIAKLDTQQMAIKIMMNSLYGALNNRWFRYYDSRVGEAITLSGQLSIRWAEKTANEFMNKILDTDDKDYVVAIDTDSLYINFGPLVEKLGLTDKDKTIKVIDQIAEEKFVPLFTKSYQQLAEYMDAYSNKMVMGREVIADSGIWTAKKRYILNVLNSEGVQYAKPKLKISFLNFS